ncbi:hypothetical protein U1Q18_014039 [Sarracenia purpurea var. burkii]
MGEAMLLYKTSTSKPDFLITPSFIAPPPPTKCDAKASFLWPSPAATQIKRQGAANSSRRGREAPSTVGFSDRATSILWHFHSPGDSLLIVCSLGSRKALQQLTQMMQFFYFLAS